MSEPAIRAAAGNELTTADLVAELRRRDVLLQAEGGNLRVNAPQGALTSELRAQIAGRKAEILALLRRPPGGGGRDLPADAVAREAIPIARLDRPLPLSFSQQGLWFLDRLEPGKPTYNIFDAIRVTGRLEEQRLRRSLGEIVRRHEVLRTTFPAVDGQPVQTVGPPAPVPLPRIDLAALGEPARGREARRLAAAEAGRPFDLASGPLLRFRLLRLAGDDFLLLITVHHIVADAWSMVVLMREMLGHYEALAAGRPAPLAELPVQYADFAAWQRDKLRGQFLDQQLAYWRQQLAGAPTLLELPTDRPRPPVQSLRGALEPFALGKRSSAALKALCRRRGVTPLVVLAAALSGLLHRTTSQRTILLGLAVAGRDRAETEALIGFFVNMLVLRTDLAAGSSLNDLLEGTRETVAGALAHQHLPFDRLVDELQVRRDLSHSPLFQVALVMQNLTVPRVDRGGLALESMAVHNRTTKSDLSWLVREGPEGFEGQLEYATDLFDATTVRRLAGHLENFVAGLVLRPDQRLDTVSVLSAAERHQLLVDWRGAAAGEAEDLPVHRLVEAVAAARPQDPAVIFGGEHLAYAELDRRANGLAHHLRSLGIACGAVVGLCVERSLEMIVGILGIQKAGGAYLPIDPAYPPERLDYLLRDAGVALVLVSEATARRLPAGGPQGLRLDDPVLAASDENPGTGATADDLAYLIYTSGSTGGPKGVMVSHRNLARSTAVRRRHYGGRVGAFLLLPSFSFDSSVAVIFWTLCDGGALVIPEEGTQADPEHLLALSRRHRVTHLLGLPSIYALLLARVADQPLPELELDTVIVAGEACPREVVELHRELRPGSALYNEYGPTEGTVWSTVHRCGIGDPRLPVPIGRPIAGVRVELLDAALQPVPIGVPGEVCLGGIGVARGYHRRPGLTAERFVPDPWSGRPGGRLYRTGDLGRFRPAGVIDFLGRRDQQVKIRGYRIELGEIEEALHRHPAVNQAAVLAVQVGEGAPAAHRLVAFAAATGEGADVAAELGAFLQARLPPYMVPPRVEVLAELPRTPNGKVDRRSLARRARSGAAEAEDFVAPRTALEERLAAIWGEVLGRRRVGVHDNFFALGGDSIMSIQVVAKASAARLGFTTQDLFRHQTIAELATAARTADTAAGDRTPVTGPAPLTPIQRWFFDQGFADPHHWNQAVLLEVRPGADPVLLERTLRHLVEHHDALRLRFERRAGGWRQFHAEDAGVGFTVVDRSRIAAGAAHRAALAARVQSSLDLTRGPLLRAVYFAAGEGRPGRLLLVVHHLVVDGVSWRILLADFQILESQLRRGEPVLLPPKTTSYRAWGEKLLAAARSPDLGAERDVWLQRPAGPARLPADLPGGRGTVATAGTVTVGLSREETRALVREAAPGHRAGVEELLLAALVETLGRWCAAEEVWLDLESHGREPQAVDGADLSRTVGWFTTLCPVLFAYRESRTPVELLRSVKERLRSVPSRGIGYGLLQYVGEGSEAGDGAEAAAELAALPRREVLFNYLGRIDVGSGRLDGLLRLVDEPVGPLRAAAGSRTHLLELNASIVAGELRLDWGYSDTRHHRATIERRAGELLAALRQLIARRAPPAAGYIPSDFPLAGLDQAGLDRLLAARGAIEDLYPASPIQQGLLFHAAFSSGLYFLQFCCWLHGDLDVTAFRRSWQRIVDRHPILRTGFVSHDLERPLQAVDRTAELDLAELDWQRLEPAEQESQLAAFLALDRERGFDLSRPPLTRLALIRHSAGTYRFVWSYHHLLLDGWSLPLIFGEVMATYRALCRGREPEIEATRPYRDYIAWLEQQDLAQAESYWRRTLAGVTAPTPLGVDGGRDLVEGDARPAAEEMRWPPALLEKLEALCRDHRLTINSVLLGAWSLMLSRYSGEQDVVFGVTLSGRPGELAGVESMVGLFINTLPMRVRVPEGESLLPWLAALQESQVELRRYEYSPLVEVQSWSEVPGGVPLFGSILVVQNYPVEPALRQQVERGDGNLRIREPRAIEHPHYPLSIVVTPHEGLSIRILYDQERFETTDVRRILGHFGTVLQGFAAGSGERLAEVPVLAAAERHQLLYEWNDTRAVLPPARSLPELFTARLERHREAIAVVAGEHHLSYGELDRRAGRLAGDLRRRGVGAEARVGILSERSPEMVIGLLGVLKAGGAYVPVDPSFPRERLAYLLEDGGVGLVLTQDKLAAKLAEHGVEALCLDAAAEGGEEEAPAAGPRPGDLAYVIHTSGSTGWPKGVMIPHRGLMNYLLWATEAYDLDAGRGSLVHSSLGFDLTVTGLWGPLLTGRRVVLLGGDAGIESLAPTLLREPGASVVKMTPAHLEVMTQEVPAAAAASLSRLLILGGEALLWGEGLTFWRRHAPATRVINEYGPTETVVGCSVHQVEAERPASEAVPIGRPIANTRLHVLDARLRPVPIGVAGELLIGGSGLARGYLGRPAQTADKFVPDPFADDPGARLYRTGDRVRSLPDGVLVYVGRIDRQVKVHGIRLELEEVRSTLNRHPKVRDSAVLLRPDGRGGDVLVAYYVARQEIEEAELHSFLADYLLLETLPRFLCHLRRLPLTLNGKVNYEALPTLDRIAPRTAARASPRGNPVEETLAAIWCRVLGIERVSRDDNFFLLGGQSLLATRVLSQIRDAFEIELPLRRLFEAPTVAGLAVEIDTVRRTEAGPAPPPITPIPRDRTGYPLSFAQQRLWFIDRLMPESRAYNVPAIVRLSGELHLPALGRAFFELVCRHEILRTRFSSDGDRPLQVVDQPPPPEMPLVDLGRLPAAARELEARRLATAEVRRPFHLERGPLLRVTLLRLTTDEHMIVAAMHHIVSDGWSKGILIGELASLYGACSAGEEPELPALPVQYVDYAHWQRTWLEGDALEEQLAYWRQQLGGPLPTCELPTDRPRSAVHTSVGARHSIALPEALTRDLQTLAVGRGATLFMTLLAAFAVLLHRATGQRDLIVGTNIAGRDRSEIEGLIGFFLNVLVLRIDASGNPSFEELLARVRTAALGAYAHQDLPFDKLVEELKPSRDPARQPFAQLKVDYQDVPPETLEIPGLRLTPVEPEVSEVRSDLTLTILRSGEELQLSFEYNTDLFLEATIADLAADFEILLEAIVRQTEADLRRLASTVDEAHRQRSVVRGRKLKRVHGARLKTLKRKLITEAHQTGKVES